MNATELIGLLRKNGWSPKNQEGSHRHFVHDEKKGKITVPFHGKKDIAPGTLNAILKKAGLK